MDENPSLLARVLAHSFEIDVGTRTFAQQWARLIDRALAIAREEERERCAQVADSFRCGACGMDGKAAAAIREMA